MPDPRAELGHERYLALPVLDATAPTHEQIAHGVRWIDERLGHGPVLVRCALGHGRSATLITARKLVHGAGGATRRKIRSAAPEVRGA